MAKVSQVRRFAADVYPWDPSSHLGEQEPVESMRERLDQAWPGLLAKDGLQQIGQASYHYFDGSDRTMRDRRRRLRRTAFTVDAAVPADYAARLDPALVGGAVLYEETGGI